MGFLAGAVAVTEEDALAAEFRPVAPVDLTNLRPMLFLDQLGFAVASRLGFTSLSDIAARRYPLRVSVRGSIDAGTPIMVDVVLREHGFSLADIEAWGGEIVRDQPMPNDPSRIGRLAAGEIDAIFDEGVIMWADLVTGAGAEFLALGPAHLAALEAQGFSAARAAGSARRR